MKAIQVSHGGKRRLELPSATELAGRHFYPKCANRWWARDGTAAARSLGLFGRSPGGRLRAGPWGRRLVQQAASPRVTAHRGALPVLPLQGAG